MNETPSGDNLIKSPSHPGVLCINTGFRRHISNKNCAAYSYKNPANEMNFISLGIMTLTICSV